VRTCEDFRDQFSAMADGALAPDELTACRGHLETCAECAREWQRFEATLALLHGAAPVRAPAGFVDRVTASARPAWPTRLVRAVFVPMRVKLPLEAAGLALVSVIALVLVQRTPDVPPIVPAAPQPLAVVMQAAREPAAANDTKKREMPAAAPPAMSPAPPAVAEHLVSERRQEVADAATPKAGQSLAAPRIAVERSAPTTQTYVPTAAAPRAAVKSTAQSPPAPGAIARMSMAPVTGSLVVRDRERAGTALADLVTRVGATETSRNVAGTALVVEIDLPRGTYATFADGLVGIGGWKPDRTPEEPSAPLRVILRLTEN